MSAPAFALAAMMALLAPVAVAILATRRRGGDPAAQIAAIVPGLGAALVGIWYASSVAALNAGSVLAGGMAGAVALTPGLIGRAAAPGSVRRRHLLVLGFTGALLAGLCVIPFLTYGLERADGIHRLSMTDWEKHLMFVTELSAFDRVPPDNPFLRAAGTSPYYAGFHLLAALPTRAFGDPSTAFASLLMLTLMTALLLPFVAYTLARALAAEPTTALIAAVGVSLLGGFDLVALAIDGVGNLLAAGPLPDGLAGLRELVPSINPDYWNHHNERQFYPPYRNAIWAPQHLLGGLMAVLVVAGLWRDPEDRYVGDGIPLGVAMVATAMLSAYTAIALGAGLVATAAWMLVTASRPGGRTIPRRWLAAGVTTMVLGLPFAAQLASSSAAGLQVALSAAGSWQNGALFGALLGDSTLTRLLDTPAVMMFELGALGVLGLIGLRRCDRADRRVVVFLLAVATVAVLLRPPVGGPNNLYPRALMVVWILLAPYAAATARSMSRPLLIAALTPCLLYTPYAMVGATLEGYLFWSTPLADHAVAAWIEEGTAPATVVAFAPEERPTYLTYWTRRPVVFHDSRLALLFGATDDQVGATEAALNAAYAEARPRVAAEAFRVLGADLVVVDATTPQARAWAASPCFITGYRSDRWMAAAPEPEACPR